jgi:hypothetical protein
MARKSDIERAKALAMEAITLCDELGLEISAAHFQLGFDSLPQGATVRVREDRAAWGSSPRHDAPARRDPQGES